MSLPSPLIRFLSSVLPRALPHAAPGRAVALRLLGAAAAALSCMAAPLPALAQAEGPSCAARADERKLAGAARASFIKKCEADAAAAADSAPADPVCETLATEKKLAGAARTSFVKKCTANPDAAQAQALCEKQAAEKKLAGAARTSYVTRCVGDAGY